MILSHYEYDDKGGRRPSVRRLAAVAAGATTPDFTIMQVNGVLDRVFDDYLSQVNYYYVFD